MELQTNIKSGDVKISGRESGNQTAQPASTTEKVIGQKEPDLVTRVSQVKEPEAKVEKPAEKTDDKQTENPFGLTREDWEKVNQDPVLSKYYKSMYSDYQKKTQDMSNERYHLQQQVKDLEAKATASSNWSPEKIQSLLNNPEFVKAAQQHMASQAPSTYEGTQEEWSSLSEPDKAKFQQLEKKITLMEQQNYQTQKVQQDEALKTRYENYSPQAVDIITADLLSGKVQATREDLWKVHDYEDGIRRAYALGRKDEREGTKEKVSSASVEGITTSASKETLTPEKNESGRAFLSRLYFSNKKQTEEKIRK